MSAPDVAPDWFAIVIATGLITAAWSSLWSLVAYLWRARRDSINVALRAAISLERYAISCWPISYSGPQHFKETGSPFLNSIPRLESMPDDAEWKGVRSALTDAALTFQNKIRVAEVQAAHADQFEGNAFDVDSAATILGVEAWQLAERLRAAHRLPAQVEIRNALAAMLDS